MKKNEKSKKKSIDRLRMVLDDNSGSNVHPDDEKYLKALRKRLGDSSKHVVYTNKSYKNDSESETDSLEPRVTIHLRDEDIVEFPEITMEEPEEEPPHKDEELYEVEKVEVDSPEFIEVKPKEVAKKGVTIEERPKEIKQPEPVEEALPEWEPVPAEKEDIKEEQIEPEEKTLPAHVEKKEEGISNWEIIKTEEIIKEEKVGDIRRFCIDCGAKLEEGYEFCHKCSAKVVSISKEEKKVENKPIMPSPVELKTTSGWEPVDEKVKEETVEKADIEQLEESIKEDVSVKEKEKLIDAFNGIKSIDQKTAKLLYENEITSIDILKEKPIKELTKIKGIKRKLAKKIKKDLKEYRTDYKPVDESFERGENPYVRESEGGEEWDSYYERESPVEEFEEVAGYKHQDYTLYEKEVETGSGKKRIVRFFSKAKPDDGDPIELPKGYEVKKNKKTGVPYLRKKK